MGTCADGTCKNILVFFSQYLLEISTEGLAEAHFHVRSFPRATKTKMTEDIVFFLSRALQHLRPNTTHGPQQKLPSRISRPRGFIPYNRTTEFWGARCLLLHSIFTTWNMPHEVRVSRSPMNVPHHLYGGCSLPHSERTASGFFLNEYLSEKLPSTDTEHGALRHSLVTWRGSPRSRGGAGAD